MKTDYLKTKIEEVLYEALKYIKSGFSVLPTGKNKIPKIKSWGDRKERIPSEETVKSDFSKSGTCVALVAGKVSGGLEVLDFDFHAEFFEPWKELVEKQRPGLVQKLVKQKTQNGGSHIIYRCSETEIPGNMKLASDFIEVSEQGEHEFKNKRIKAIKRNEKFYITPCFIETRGEGGYFLVDPSPGYKIEKNRLTDISDISKEERDILIQSAKSLNKFVPEHTTPSIKKSSEGLTPGDDFNQRGEIESILQKNGWVNTGKKTTVNGDSGEHWLRPGKYRGVSATLINNRYLYVFSTNAPPFESDQVYSPFAIYAMLEHDGDFSAAAKELSSQSYGAELKPAIVKPRSLSFPDQVMTGSAGYFANVHASVMEVPKHFLFISYLTFLGAVLSRRLTINSELKTQPRLYVAIVGESATDRKSTALKITDDHFRSVLNEFCSCWGVGSAEGLQSLMQKKNTKGSQGVILIFDEMKSFVNKCKIEASVLLPAVNTLFESNRFESHTKKRAILIHDAHLSLLAASTLETYERLYDSAFIAIGFPNRVFLVTGTAKRQFSLPKKVPQYEIDKMKENLVKILRHVGDGLELDITPEGKEIFHQWYLGLDSSVHARRLDGYALRFMMLLAANNLKNEIDVETVQHAIALCDWELEIRKTHDPIDADTNVAKMEERIRRALRREALKDYELKKKTNAHRAGLYIYDCARNNLKKGKEIGWDKKEKKWFLAE